MTKLLLQHNADVNARNKNNQTGLHYAARNLDAPVLVLLLQAGIDANQEDLQPYERPGMTALDAQILKSTLFRDFSISRRIRTLTLRMCGSMPWSMTTTRQSPSSSP
jgi:ankyrin repeat protein